MVLNILFHFFVCLFQTLQLYVCWYFFACLSFQSISCDNFSSKNEQFLRKKRMTGHLHPNLKSFKLCCLPSYIKYIFGLLCLSLELCSKVVMMGKQPSASIKSVKYDVLIPDLRKLGKIFSYFWAMVCSVIYFTLIDFAVTLVKGNSYSTAEKIIQAGKNSRMNENQQGNTQKRKYQNVLDIALSALVSLSSF